MTVRPGEIVGFVGRNGSGKTTTMRSILGLIEPDEGTILYSGRVKTHRDNAQIGYMPEERGLFRKMKVLDQLTYFGELQGMSSTDARASANQLLERFGIKEFGQRELSKLSLGNQQRIQFIASLVHRPSLLILDEPFSGLDPIALSQFEEILREFTAEGAAILFSSHQLDLVSQLCDRIVIIDEGRVIAEDTLSNLQGGRTVRYRIRGENIPLNLTSRFPSLIAYEDSRSIIATFDRRNLEFEKNHLLKLLIEECSLNEFIEIKPTLSEIYRKLVDNG
jgi:ABC-2 type transport system ATP-binding protein